MIERDYASRRRIFALLGCLGLLLIASPPGSWARAQEGDRGPAPSNATAAGARGGTDADAPGTTADPGDRAGEGQSFLGWAIEGSGWIGLVIVLMSFYMIAVIAWMFLHYRMPVAAPGDLVEEVEGLLDKARYNEAYQRVAEDGSFLARVLTAGVRKLPGGLDQGRRAMELANEDATMQMEHRTTYLATVGTLGPMIGLVGTVYGMILSFRVIATEGASPQASDLARGISTALFATLLGIAVSIPAIFFHALFRNRIARLSLEVGLIAEPLLERFLPGVRMAGPASSPGPGSAPPPSPPSPPPHAHPFAVNAAMAAGGRPALPPADPSPAGDSH